MNPYCKRGNGLRVRKGTGRHVQKQKGLWRAQEISGEEKIKTFTKEEVERIKKLTFQATQKNKSRKGGSAKTPQSHKLHRYHKPK
jgi:hypothetical protein